MTNRQLAVLEAVRKGYTVDNAGDVFSPEGNSVSTKHKSGYPSFSVKVGKTRITVDVHRLVAFNKFGEVALSSEVRHRNDNILDNSWDNILIGNHSDNMMDISPQIRLEKANNAASHLRKLTEEQIKEIRFARNCGATYATLCRRYGISKTSISYIVNHKTYKLR